MQVAMNQRPLWLDPPRLTLASARNLARLWDHQAGAMGRPCAHWPEVWAADSGSPNPFPNSATLLAPLTPETAPAVTERLERFYAAGTGGPWLLWCPWPAPVLARLGFGLDGHPPLMVCPPGALRVPRVSDLEIVEVRDAAGLEAAERVLVDGFPVPELQPYRPGSMLDTRVLGGDWHIFLGFAGGRPVTTSSALVSDGVVGVHMVATLPEARGRGYGAAITAHAAHCQPKLPAVLQSSDMGRPVYLRLGFTIATRFSLWYHPRTV